jgi:pilus assembly protein CpaF
MEDSTVTEIMINKFNEIYVEVEGKMIRTGDSFDNEERLEEFIQALLGRLNKVGNERNPIVHARMIDGSRIQIVLPPIALRGPTVCIRKFSKINMNMTDLVTSQRIPTEVAAYLKWAIEQRKNIFISGGTGTGKTTLLRALTSFIPENERVITIEDTAELTLGDQLNLVQLECRTSIIEQSANITIRDLIRTSLRLRPDRIIVGEVRGAEVIDMLSAMNTGHEGSLSTGHSNSPRDLIGRLETMAMLGSNLPIELIRRQIRTALHIIVHLERNKEGQRYISEICEIVPENEFEIQLRQVYISDCGGYIEK